MESQTQIDLDGVSFFSNFDSGNLNRAVKTGPNQYELYVAPDAACSGYNYYRIWFYFGIRGLRKGTFFKITLMNLCNLRLFSSPVYRPVWKALPEQPEWQRIQSEFSCEISNGCRLTWVFEQPFHENEIFFAFVPPYTYADVMRSLAIFELNCPTDSLVYREVMTRSLDGRDCELVTISHKSNFALTKEKRLEGLFPTSKDRSWEPLKPIVFISARVHPGETPASYMLESFMKVLLSNDRRAFWLRTEFVFKIIPILNPDGVYRGHYRVDENGNNLNRYYIRPSPYEHPTIFATKHYFEYLSVEYSVLMYMDFHAHASKKGCFFFGNCLENEEKIQTELYAKLVSLNSMYFDWEDSDFSEKSMSTKDPYDTNTKEGSGRVALHKSTGVVYGYTVECSYYIPRPLHYLTSLLSVKTGKKQLEESLKTSEVVKVHNEPFFDDVGKGLAYSILDLFEMNVVSRVPSSTYRCLENIKNFIREKVVSGMQKIPSKEEFKSRNRVPPRLLPKVANRQVHQLPVIVPKIPDRVAVRNFPKRLKPLVSRSLKNKI